MTETTPQAIDIHDLVRRVAALFAAGHDSHSIAAALCVKESDVANILPAARRLK